LKGKEQNVLSNKLIDVVNSSKPIKQDDKCHNVASKTRDQKGVTSPILLLFAV
jgi:hypothetical protein